MALTCCIKLSSVHIVQEHPGIQTEYKSIPGFFFVLFVLVSHYYRNVIQTIECENKEKHEDAPRIIFSEYLLDLSVTVTMVLQNSNSNKKQIQKNNVCN